MKRWFWSVLMLVAAMAALTVGASAEYVKPEDVPEGDTVIEGAIYHLVEATTDKDAYVTLTGYTDGFEPTLIIREKVNGVPVEKIEPNAFTKNTSLQKIIIPESVVDIGSKAFEQCTTLTDVIFREFEGTTPTKPVTIQSEAFASCTQLKTASFSAKVNTDIQSSAFRNCESLTAVALWKGSIASNAFGLCFKLDTVVVGNKVTVEKDSFFENMKIIHFVGITRGDLKTKQDGPLNKQTGWNNDRIHLIPEANITRDSSDTTCVDKTGSIVERVWCSDESCKKFIIDRSGKDTIIIPLLGHDIVGHVDDEDTQLRKAIQAAEAAGTYKGCEDFSWTYNGGTCSRPGCTFYAKPITEDRIDPAKGHKYGLTREAFASLFGDPSNSVTFDPDDFDSVGARLVLAALNKYDPDVSPVSIFEILPSDLQADLQAEQPEYAEKLENIMISGFEESTCAEQGYIQWTVECTYECGKGDAPQEIKLTYNGTNHTYTQHYTTEIRIAPTCLYDGFVVEYYVCDGDKAHGGDHTGVIRGCPQKSEDGPQYPDDIKNNQDLLEYLESIDALKDFSQLEEYERGKCDELIVLEALIEALEKAADAYGLPPDIQEKIEAGEEADVTAEDLDDPNLAILRQAVKDAVMAYGEHLFNEHGAPDECVASQDFPVDTNKDLKTDYWKSLGKPVYTNPTEDGPFLCFEGGLKITEDFCPYCGKILPNKEVLQKEKKGHSVNPLLVEKISSATCTEAGKILYKEGARCSNYDYNCSFYVKEDTIMDDPDDPPTGHDWGDFVPDDPDEDMHQEETCESREVWGTVSCKNECGVAPQKTSKIIPGKAGHTWGEWKVTKEPTKEEPGEQTRTCQVCGKTEPDIIPPTGETENPGQVDPDPEEPDKPAPDTNYYTISTSNDGNGTATPSVTSARGGTRVTVTVTPKEGYEVDKVRVTGNTFGTDLSGGSYAFTMPYENVMVTASFSKKTSSVNANWTGSAGTSASTQQTVVQSIPQAGASGQLFSDVPATHWASGEISWANQMGYMNGTSGGGFNPNGVISHQQLWMVLARLTGSNPSSMADAKRWAVNGGFADGSAPEGSVSRHQLVTALYRCAHLMGTLNKSTASLAGFPDSRTVPIGAREPFAWAVANGIIGGDASGRLNPNGTLTRAQFAVFLYRFSQRV